MLNAAYSQSFRSLEFLRHGLPLLCNRYLPIAGLVESFDAGWPVDGPHELESLLSSITAAPQDWARKSAEALRLVNEVLRPDRSVSPLLEWLKSPVRAPRLPAALRSFDIPPVLGVPPFRQRLGRQFKLARQVALARIFGSRSAGKGGATRWTRRRAARRQHLGQRERIRCELVYFKYTWDSSGNLTNVKGPIKGAWSNRAGLAWKDE